jgi:phage tail sheath protein FI
LTTSSLALTAVATAVIGLVATADDADADVFPLDTPVLINDVRAALAKAGATGTLAKALTAIADQANPTMIIVRVAHDADSADQDALVTGATHGGYTGLNALLVAKHLTGTQPRIIGAPGLESPAVLTALATTAKALRGMAYAHIPATTKAAAIAARANYSHREMMLIWPNTSTGDIAARAMGLRALIDQTTGWHKTVSNVALTGVTATDVPVTWTLDGANSDAADLNAAQITTIVNTGDAWVLWGNRTTASGTELPYAFESATRTSQIVQDTIDTARLKYTDQPMDKMLIKMIIDETRRWLRWSPRAS